MGEFGQDQEETQTLERHDNFSLNMLEEIDTRSEIKTTPKEMGAGVLCGCPLTVHLAPL